ncbi:MAG: hypothetical protein N2482_01315 [Patescibacteria group bacterium]|nr:hypothetical protein [Patescibacteria group bacterium]
MLIFIFGLILRVYNLKDNFIFAYDQARDAQRVWEIIYEKNLKIVGPETDIPGVFNGPLLYYLLAPLYFLSNFDPNLAALTFTLINLSGVILFYFFGRFILKNNKFGLIASFLWTISYAQLNFSRFISNASLMSITTLGFFFFLSMYIFKKRDYGLILSSIFISLAIHSNFYLIYLLGFYPILFLIYKLKPNKRLILKTLFFLIIMNSNFIISQIKWNFISFKSLISYFLNQSEIKNNILDSISMYIQRISEAIFYSFFSFNIFLSFLFFLFLIILFYRQVKINKKIKLFLSMWLFSTFPLFGFRSGVLNMVVINSTIFPVLTIIVSIFIYELKKLNKYLFFLVLIIIIFSNLFLYLNDNFSNTKLFALQSLLFKNEKEVLDYIYQSSKKENFSVCAVTNPLFINTLWSFLFKFYGEKKFGYLPYWSGQHQFLNKNFLPYLKKSNSLKTRYLIIEPEGGMPNFAVKTSIFLEDEISNLIEEKKFGSIRVQKRFLKSNKNKFSNSQKLSPEEILLIKKIKKIDPRYSCFHEY